jgi:ATP-dependent RNA helicase DDX10/DBP4
MTEIQRCTIPHLLQGRDLLGASKTGSGKTLSYLIPVIERLYMQKWTPYDGLGSIIILPTRELVK